MLTTDLQYYSVSPDTTRLLLLSYIFMLTCCAKQFRNGNFNCSSNGTIAMSSL